LPTYVIGYWGVKGSGFSTSLSYLLAPDDGMGRLDQLVPFELKSKRGGEDGSLEMERILDFGTTKSGVTAGLSIDALMG
jgi:hypothetical protein